MTWTLHPAHFDLSSIFDGNRIVAGSIRTTDAEKIVASVGAQDELDRMKDRLRDLAAELRTPIFKPLDHDKSYDTGREYAADKIEESL